MYVICSDMEGVFVPEIWVNVAKKTGIEELKITTRDEPDYNKLMKKRIQILEENNLTLSDIQDVIAEITPMDGAKDFIDWMKKKTQLFVLSDTFTQFASPLMKQLGYPTLMCNTLEVGGDNMIKSHSMRQDNGKKKVVQALHSLQYKVIAFGDSYNDIAMIKEADFGMLFKPPQNVIDEFPEIPVTNNYEEVKEHLRKYIEK